MPTLSKANHKPCRVCKSPKRLTPALKRARYGMPCRPCLCIIFQAMRDERLALAAAQTAQPKPAVAVGYHYR